MAGMSEKPEVRSHIAESNARHTHTKAGLHRGADHPHNKPSAEQAANMSAGRKTPYAG